MLVSASVDLNNIIHCRLLLVSAKVWNIIQSVPVYLSVSSGTDEGASKVLFVLIYPPVEEG